MICVYIDKNVYIHPIIRAHIYTQRERYIYIYRIYKERWKQWNSWQNRHPSRTHIGGSCQLREGFSRPVHQGSTVTNLHITLGPYCEKVQLFGCFLPTFHGKNSMKYMPVNWKQHVNLAPRKFHFMTPLSPSVAISIASERHSTTAGTGITGVVSVEVSSLPAQ